MELLTYGLPGLLLGAVTGYALCAHIHSLLGGGGNSVEKKIEQVGQALAQHTTALAQQVVTALTAPADPKAPAAQKGK